jgi:hypothetical protein
MVMCLLNGAILLLFPTGTPLIIPRLYLHDSIIEEITRWKKKIIWSLLIIKQIYRVINIYFINAQLGSNNAGN